MSTCSCGSEKHPKSAKCTSCHKADLKKFMKYAAVAGVILGLVCSHLPRDYHKPCQSIAGLLGSC